MKSTRIINCGPLVDGKYSILNLKLNENKKWVVTSTEFHTINWKNIYT